MTPLTSARLALALVAAILLGWGIRTDNSAIRLAGIGFLVAALAMRFVKPRDRQ